MKKILWSMLMVIIVTASYAQPSSLMIQIPLQKSLSLSSECDKYKVQVKNRVLPKPVYKGDAQAITNAHQYLLPLRAIPAGNGQAKSQTLLPPAMLQNFMGNAFMGFVPNDNDMAISDSGFITSVVNSAIWHKNLQTNQITGATLHNLSLSLGLQNEEFDPKLMYDPEMDRFVVLFLNGFSDSTSNVVVGFSQTNQPNGMWNFYTLPGNPLNNGLWTDFPMMALTHDELFITVNLLYPDSSWQTGFNETIIWQIKKMNGYNGSTLQTMLHNNITLNGSKLRNLCPVKGGSGLHGPEMYFLSNRNFTTGNDTIFLVKINDTINAPGQVLTVTPIISPIQYMMPADAIQPYIDLLATNDARVLGAFIENDKIQFTSNCFDAAKGVDGIFHGVMSNVSTSPSLYAYIYSDAAYDYGYANISYAGNGVNDHRSIFSLLYTSSTVFPGFGAVLFDGISDYSTVTNIKTGTGYINMLSGNERWGDYMGNQRKYNQPGIVWVSGQYSLTNHTTRTYIAEISANTSVGTSEASIPQQAVVAPNPVGDMAHVFFTLLSPAYINVNLLNVEGKQIAELYRGGLKEGSNEIVFSTQTLAAGNYIVSITQGNGEIIVRQKIVK